MARGWKSAVAAALCVAGCSDVSWIVDTTHPPAPVEEQPRIAVLPTHGDLVIAGGIGNTLGTIGSSEFYQQSTGKFFPTGSLSNKLAGVQSTSLSGGASAALVAGGSNLEASLSVTTGILTFTSHTVGSAALYDALTGRFAATGKMVSPRAFAATARLADGTVLIAGGFDAFAMPSKFAQIYHPSTGEFTATTGQLHVPRALATAALLPNGKVLVAGGMVDKYSMTTTTAEIYDPATGNFTVLASKMPASLAGMSATMIRGCECQLDNHLLLADGVFGFISEGSHYVFTNAVAVTFNPVTYKFAETATLPSDPRLFHSATLLPGGRVLLAGGAAGALLVNEGGSYSGYSTNKIQQSAEIFNPVTGIFTCVGGASSGACNPSMTASRAGQATQWLTSGPFAGKVLLAGGLGGTGSFGPLGTQDSAEFFTPSTQKFTAAAASLGTARAFASAFVVP